MYAKLFSSLYQGTLRGCADELLVFTNLLAYADMHGVVDKHWRAIADETGISVERVKAAITNLEAPDPESRSPEMDGRRIIPIDEHRAWGWQIVNHGKYRSIKNEDDRREQNRIAQQKWREKHVSNSKQTVSTHKPDKPIQKQIQIQIEEVGSDEPKPRKVSEKNPDVWIETLKKEPIYAHIDFDRELRKAEIWINDHPGRKLTQTFFKNWINKIEPPIIVPKQKPLLSPEQIEAERVCAESQKAFYGQI